MSRLIPFLKHSTEFIFAIVISSVKQPKSFLPFLMTILWINGKFYKDRYYIVCFARPVFEPIGSSWGGGLTLYGRRFRCHPISADGFNVPRPVLCFISSRPGQNGRHFPEGIFKCIFLNENKYEYEINDKFRLRFHWRLFPRVPLTIFQPWFI